MIKRVSCDQGLVTVFGSKWNTGTTFTYLSPLFRNQGHIEFTMGLSLHLWTLMHRLF